MVSTGIVHRYLGGEKLGCLIHKAFEYFLFIVENRDHIAIEQKHIGLFQIAMGNQFFQHITFSVDIVDHGKVHGLPAMIAGQERQRLLAVNRRCRHIPVNHPPADMA